MVRKACPIAATQGQSFASAGGAESDCPLHWRGTVREACPPLQVAAIQHQFAFGSGRRTFPHSAGRRGRIPRPGNSFAKCAQSRVLSCPDSPHVSPLPDPASHGRGSGRVNGGIGSQARRNGRVRAGTGSGPKGRPLPNRALQGNLPVVGRGGIDRVPQQGHLTISALPATKNRLEPAARPWERQLQRPPAAPTSKQNSSPVVECVVGAVRSPKKWRPALRGRAHDTRS